jgi:intein/homing endonuclease
MHVLETSAKFLDVDYDPDSLVTTDERVAYIRGYFDAEGGIPRKQGALPYIQLVQKNRIELEQVRSMLSALGITCGRMHNPSVEVDPDYWRFYVLAASRPLFARLVGSWHPRKEDGLLAMVRSRKMI